MSPITVPAAVSIEGFHRIPDRPVSRPGPWFGGVLVIVPPAGRTKRLDFVLHAMKDDGSLARNKGRFYLYMDINERARRKAIALSPDRWGMNRCLPCQECSRTLSLAVHPIVSALLEKEGFPAADWKLRPTDSGFSLFHVWSRPVTRLERTGNDRQMGEECVLVEFVQTLNCPVHGRTRYYEDEPVD